MSEACPLDLNYGHFGEPSYDSENHKWHFPRQPGRVRELKPVGPLVRAIQSPLHGATAHIQRATERTQNIKDLTRQYPALQPASSLLPELAQVSEVVEEVTSGHDPTVSELLAIGEAVDPHSRGHGFKTVSIAAFAGGSTGESVRVVLLHKEKLGWKDSKNIRLNAFTSKGGEEGWWTGNGSPMQQLVFAEAEGRPTSWLAVRYHGAISVLRPQLRRNAGLLPLAYAASNRTSQSRLSADHIVTLPMDKANGVPYSDVTFNPWYNQQIATIDQTGAWAVWDVEKTEKRAKGKTFWTINKIRHGGLHDDLYEGETLPSNVADGWGAVLWAGDLSTVIVAGRRMLAIFDIKGSSRRLVTPNLVSVTTSEWILDVKRSSKDPTHVFVTTTFRVFWLQVASFAGNHARGEMAAGAKCLLSWRHFRDPGDISLSLQVADDSAREDVDDNRQTILVLLYSRLTGLMSVFAFHCSRSQSNLAPYASDPYILTLPNDEPGTFTSRATSFGSHRSPRISAVVLKAIRYESPQGSVLSGPGKIFHENGVAFYQLSLLTNDLALSECLYAEAHNNFKAELCPPNTIRHSHIAKTPAKSFDEFIVPDGYIDRELEDSPDDRAAEEVSEAENQASLVVPNEDPHTTSFEWLDNEIHDTLNNAFPTVVFDESLELLRNAIEDKMSSGNMTTESLLRVVDMIVSVVDIDKASGDFVDFLDDIQRLSSEYEDWRSTDEERKLVVSNILTSTLQAGLGIRDTTELSSIYESLIQTWMVPMSRGIPGRVRIAFEKSLRDLACRICLASHAIRVDSGTKAKEGKDQQKSSEANARFVLPVRRRTSVTSLGKGKTRLDASSSPPPASSQMSEDAGFMNSSAFDALPTPEATPSLRSRSSISSLAGSEDLASQRLRAYASLAPQPALPAKMSNLLDHWQLGVDPAKYDWEAAQQVNATADGSEEESRKRKRQRQEKRLKRQRENPVGPSSQRTPKRLGDSQPQQGQEAQAMQGSSQQTEKAVTMSQVQPGKFGGRHAKTKKPRVLKPRPAGFK